MMLQEFISIITFFIGCVFLLWYTSPARWYTYSCFSLCDKNDKEKAKKWLIQDLSRAKETVFIVTRTGCNDFWGDAHVVKAFRKAAKRKVEINFIVGKDFERALKENDREKSSNVVSVLHNNKIIKLRVINSSAIVPSVGLRLVDDNGTYVSKYTNDSMELRHNERPFLWTWNHEKVAEKQKEHIEYYIKESSPYNPDERNNKEAA